MERNFYFELNERENISFNQERHSPWCVTGAAAFDYNEQRKLIMGPLTHLCHRLVKGDPWNKVANGPCAPCVCLISLFIHCDSFSDSVTLNDRFLVPCSISNFSNYSCNTFNLRKNALLTKIPDIMWCLMMLVWDWFINLSVICRNCIQP